MHRYDYWRCCDVVFVLRSSDWLHALNTTYGVLIKLSLEGMMKVVFSSLPKTNNKKKIPCGSAGAAHCFHNSGLPSECQGIGG